MLFCVVVYVCSMDAPNYLRQLLARSPVHDWLRSWAPERLQRRKSSPRTESI